MLKQQLQQKLQQKLSPAQIQVIKMLEIPTLELEERIRQELEENPALEEGAEASDSQDDVLENEYGSDEGGNNDDMDLDEYMPDDDIPDYRLKTNNSSKDDKHESIPFSVGMTFHEFLLDQLGLQDLNEHERGLAEYVIGNIDEEGYLRRTAEAMVDDIVFQAGIQTTDEEMLHIIHVIQQFDPPGVGASDLQECLVLQLDRKTQTQEVQCAKKIVTHYFEEFTKKHYDKIMKSLSIDDETLKNVIGEIIRLNPKPGSAWSGNVLEKSMSAIVPDFMLENNDGQLTVHLNNSNVPELRVSNTYNEMMQDYAGNKQNQTKEMKDAVFFVKQKIDSARWFIDAIKQRQQTLLTTMKAIVDFQYEFFVEGDETYLKPMILKDIADITGFDISTISRVSNSKYIQTEFGVFPVKYFFSESMTNDSGEEVSTREIKKILQETIEHEDKKKPLNDDRLAEVLKDKGYNIARRTVAKYREQLNIPVARLRKEI
ncbi:RNA polymerase sigma-54 factor [Paludibacter sp. 221]|uniref:RNA polymerase factor sigma-54 n=1 Tax=Paludibacter sp. 221 TaxID=2302939 RepID=UPI0013D4EBB2|nr:RNA polymerase factor sigma-54 [Paludibacter sp. 221]NDV47807.1 RNA polymerase sigma-54 factor [Paludibacter sp. 221]